MRNKRDIKETIAQTNRSRNNTILIALIVAVLLFISFAWPFMFSFRLGIISQQNRFKNEQFEKVSVSGITDNKGTITFINSDLEVVYPEDSTLSITQEELDNMLDVEMTSQSVKTFTYIEEGKEYRQIYSEGITSRTSWYVVIDEENNYVKSENFYFIEETYTDSEVLYISNHYVRDQLDYKYYFTSNDGDEYYMVVNLDQYIVLLETYEIIILVVLVIIIITLTIILLKLPTKKLSKKLNQPIKDLADAMSKFIPGESVYIDKEYEVIEYDSIVNTFNKMVFHINNLEEENEALLQNKKDMFAAIAHDLKTPITVLNGYVNAIVNGKIKQEEYEKYYDMILTKSEQLTSLINEFAVYNEMNHSSFSLHLENKNINEVIREYFASNYQHIEENKFELLVDIPEEIIEYPIDTFQFKRVLDNLLSNFIKYNPKGTKIHIETHSFDDSYILLMENNGTPISKEISSTMFEPFVIDSTSRSNSSTGLGLSITKRIIEFHNGEISYNSSEEYCNQFIIKLHKK